MEKMGTAEPNFEQLFEEKKRVRNPLVPIGALVTAGVLTAGLISFRRGNSQLGQVLMRARVVVQGATVALMVGTAFYYGDNPWKKPKLAHDEILRSVNMDVVRIFVQVLKEGIASTSDE